METFLHLETSTVFRRLQCCIRSCRDLRGRGGVKRLLWNAGAHEDARHPPVGDVTAAGQVEVLQPLQVRRRLSHATVGDARTVAEGQAGEAAAVPSHGLQAGVGDVGEHGERQPLEVGVLHHLRREGRPSRFVFGCWRRARPSFSPAWRCCRSASCRRRGPAPAASSGPRAKPRPALWTAAGRPAWPAWVCPQTASEEVWRSPCYQTSGWSAARYPPEEPRRERYVCVKVRTRISFKWS